MQFFIGIVPPKEDRDRISSFQEKWNTLATEPHITVKAQSGLTDNLDWLEKIEACCCEVNCFNVQLGEPKLFGNEVLYLSVLSEKVKELHIALIDTVHSGGKLEKEYFERDLYVPHLTLGQKKHGLFHSELLRMKDEAKEVLTPFQQWKVECVRVYVQKQRGEKYLPYKDIFLKQTV